MKTSRHREISWEKRREDYLLVQDTKINSLDFRFLYKKDAIQHKRRKRIEQVRRKKIHSICISI